MRLFVPLLHLLTGYRFKQEGKDIKLNARTQVISLFCGLHFYNTLTCGPRKRNLTAAFLWISVNSH